MQLSAGKAPRAVGRGNWGAPREEMNSQDPSGGGQISPFGHRGKEKAVRAGDWNSAWPQSSTWAGAEQPQLRHSWSIPEVHRQWKSHTLAILARWVPPSSLGYSQKPTWNLWGVFTNSLCLKPLNLLIPRDEGTAFTRQAHRKDLIPIYLTLNLVYFKPIY